MPQRLLVRDLGRAPRLPAATPWRAEYADRAAVRAALDGVATVCMVSAAEAIDRVDQHRTFVDAARAAGVQHVVYTSFYRASPEATFTLARDHWATEVHLRASGRAVTFLREVLTDPARHAGCSYDLTGPQDLTFHEIAATLTAASGRAVTYLPDRAPGHPPRRRAARPTGPGRVAARRPALAGARPQRRPSGPGAGRPGPPRGPARCRRPGAAGRPPRPPPRRRDPG